MILTGNTLENFTEWLYKNQYSKKENEFTRVELNALIIEFFDSVGIYIDTESEEIYEYVGFYAYVNNESLNEIFKSRQEATEQAILKANEIYNERTNISNKI